MLFRSYKAYYLAPGVGTGVNKWLFVHEGKAWCMSPGDCVDRTKSTDGRGGWKSSQGACLPLTLSRRALGAVSYGQLDDDPAANPTLYNWNVVWYVPG